MRVFIRPNLIVMTLIGALGVAPLWVAAEEPILTFGFTDLDGTFVAGTNQFTAVATSFTDGDVTRVQPTPQTANFIHDFRAGGSMANVVLNMSLSNVRSTDASATGTITITDFDGDTLTAQLDGVWTPLDGFASFSGLLSSVFLNPTGDGVFEGSNNGTPDGSFSMDFTGFGIEPFSGAKLALSLPDHWFSDGSFSNANTLIEASIIPAPGAVVLGAVGLGLLGWVRKRFGRPVSA